MTTYTVTILTPMGTTELDVPSTLGPEVAGRRAQAICYAYRWADMGKAEVLSIEVTDD